MANIPFLHSHRCADGTFTWHWKPSPRLRKLGWTNQALGTTPTKRATVEIATAATKHNDRLEEWEAGARESLAAPPPPKKWLFADLVAAYRASPEFALKSDDNPEGLAASTRREYECRLRQLVFWAQDGQLPIRSIDQDMVKDLKKALLANKGSKFKAASMLRVLRMLLNWAKDARLLKDNPTEGVEIPTPPSRTQRLDWRAVLTVADKAEAAHAAAGHNDHSLAARYLRLGFWTMQRREDMRLFNRMAWRELHGADARDLPVLVNGKGQVWGFRIQQHKTGRWVDCPVPPFLHGEIEAAFEQSQWLFPHSLDSSKPISGDVLRRRVKPALVAGGFPNHQLRDLRRSGMSGVKDLGAQKSDVFAISGHPLDGQQRTMADVYMPPDTMAACRAIAAACRTLAAIAEREKENEK